VSEPVSDGGSKQIIQCLVQEFGDALAHLGVLPANTQAIREAMDEVARANQMGDVLQMSNNKHVLT